MMSALAPLGTQTVVVLGAAYGGRRCAQLLAALLPADWSLVVIDRNSHFNHVYVFPRFVVLSEHAPKAYIPYTYGFESRLGETIEPEPEAELQLQPSTNTTGLATPPLTPSVESAESASPSPSSIPTGPPAIPIPITSSTPGVRRWIRGNITSLSPHSVTFSHLPDSTRPGIPAGESETVQFDYCVYALGASLPDPVNVWTHAEPGEEGMKTAGIRFMEEQATRTKEAKSIIVVGGGAMGIQLSTDIKSVYPEKIVTLIHSRPHLMPFYTSEFHDAIMRQMDKLGVHVLLNDRVLAWPDETLPGPCTVHTHSGSSLSADLILRCTGQIPHTGYLGALSPNVVIPASRRVRVRPTLQIDEPGLMHIFAVGDCAETGAIQAGHTAHFQGEDAARNIVRLIKAQRTGKKEAELIEYKPHKPAIKVSTGLDAGVRCVGSTVTDVPGGDVDLYAGVIWDGHRCGDLPRTA